MCVVAVVYAEMFPVCVIGHIRLRRVNANRIAGFTQEVEGRTVLEMTELQQAGQ
jgi:hypothetical protein